MRSMLALALVAGLVLAGCSGDRDGPSAPTPTGPDSGAALREGTMPSGEGARDFIESYVMTHPYRVHGQATQSFMDTARTSLVALLEGFGGNYSVVRHDYPDGQNILAFKEGTTHPDQWVVLSAHYDTIGAGVGTTVYGAWDDGAGTAVLLELARAYADWEFPYTLVFALFDGEEKGLVGSREFVEEYIVEQGVDVIANLNTDPPGLNWPCGDQAGIFPVKIIHEEAKVDGSAESGDAQDRFTLLYHAVEAGLGRAGVPAEVRDYSPGIPVAVVLGTGVTGGSDHVSFGRVGVANVFIGGIPTTAVGPLDTAALTYPLHSPLDTLEAMEARCTVGTLAGGLQTTVDIFTGALTHLALQPIPSPDTSEA